jgi:FkbM family methyltransferase
MPHPEKTMHFPAIARTLMGNAGFEVHISGKRKKLLLSTCDRLFTDARSRGEVSVQVGTAALRLDLANPSERLLYYAPHNLLRSYRNSPLFPILSRVAIRSGLFVDIGANLGMYSLLARTMGLDALLFEPEPVHFAFLSRNASSIGKAVACALSNRSGTTDFFVSGPTNPGSSSLVMPEGGWSHSEYQQAVSVRLCTFDFALAELHIDAASIRLIKVDVEGNEELTVQGMRDYLSGAAPAPLWCEVRGPSSGRGRNSVHSVTNFLAQFGYKPFRYEDGHLLPFRLGHDPEPQVFDLLFAVPGLHGNVLPLQTL